MRLCNTRVLSHGINHIISRYSYHFHQISGCRLNISHFTDSNWSEGEWNARLTYFSLVNATSNAWMVPITEKHYVTHDRIRGRATFQNVDKSSALLLYKFVRNQWKISIYWLDNCAFLGYYVACSGNSLPMIWYNLFFPFSRVKNPRFVYWCLFNMCLYMLLINVFFLINRGCVAKV